MSNFFSLAAIVSGLQRPAVCLLRLTWQVRTIRAINDDSCMLNGFLDV
jgi:hypothetical protein